MYLQILMSEQVELYLKLNQVKSIVLFPSLLTTHLVGLKRLTTVLPFFSCSNWSFCDIAKYTHSSRSKRGEGMQQNWAIESFQINLIS